MSGTPAPTGSSRWLRAWQWACALDVEVAKPGNVSVEAPGHGMTAQMFLDSARVAGPPLFAAGQPVGVRIEGAVQATREAVQCNTNLGIVLLTAPLALALERCGGVGGVPDARRWHAATAAVLAALDVADAEAAYRGIALARPGGLGRTERADVAEAPTIDLRSAMALAAGRDSIARQYAHAYDDLFGFGLPAFARALDGADGGPAAYTPHGGRLAGAVLHTFLSWLAAWPDSHIVRKHGAALAQSVTGQAAGLLETPLSGQAPLVSTWDTELKTAGINPGTSADLTVATVFVAACLDPSLMTGR